MKKSIKINGNDYVFESKIGIDKLHLYGFTIKYIDITHLLTYPTSIINIYPPSNSSMDCVRYKNDGSGIGLIKIKDNELFNELKIGCHQDRSGISEFVHLILCVSNAKGFNLEPMSHREYTEYLECVIDYIESEYHIILDSQEIKIEEMEINTNLLLKNDFIDYNRVFNLLVSEFLPKSMKKEKNYNSISKNKTDKEKKEESFIRGSTRFGLKIYDKSKQLRESKELEIDNDISICRIEFELRNRQGVSYYFKTNKFHKLNDKMITDFYYARCEKLFFSKYTEWEKRRRKEIKTMIEYYKSQSKRNWSILLFEEIRNRSEKNCIPFILDMEMIFDVLRGLPDPNRNCSRVMKGIISNQSKIPNNVYTKNDTKKMNEIIDGLKESYQNTIEMTN